MLSEPSKALFDVRLPSSIRPTLALVIALEGRHDDAKSKGQTILLHIMSSRGRVRSSTITAPVLDLGTSVRSVSESAAALHAKRPSIPTLVSAPEVPRSTETHLTVYTYKPSVISSQPSPLPSTSAAPPSSVQINYASLPWDVQPGDYFEIRPLQRVDKGEALKGVPFSRRAFVFRLGDDASVPIGQVQMPDSVASAFSFQHRADVEILPLDPDDAQIDHIELRFSQYLGRADMWRLGMSLETHTVHVGQRIQLAGGAVRADVHAIYRGGRKYSSGIFTSKTKTIYRSRSAQVYLFIQLCAETWQFDEDGERYYEKIVHGELFYDSC